MASVSWDGKNSKCHKPAEAKVMLKHFDPRAESRAEIREIKDRSGEICHIRTENSKYNVDIHIDESGKVKAEIVADIPPGLPVFSSYDVTIPKHKEELKRLDALPKQNLRKNRVINQMVEFPAGDWLTFDPDGTEETKRKQEEDLKDFFSGMLQAEIDAGVIRKDQIVAAVVHLDEVHDYVDSETGEKVQSRPHMHVMIFPTESDGHLNHRDFSNRTRIMMSNQAANKFCMENYGKKYETGSKRKSKKSVQKLKRESAEKAAEAAAKEVDALSVVVEELREKEREQRERVKALREEADAREELKAILDDLKQYRDELESQEPKGYRERLRAYIEAKGNKRLVPYFMQYMDTFEEEEKSRKEYETKTAARVERLMEKVPTVEPTEYEPEIEVTDYEQKILEARERQREERQRQRAAQKPAEAPGTVHKPSEVEIYIAPVEEPESVTESHREPTALEEWEEKAGRKATAKERAEYESWIGAIVSGERAGRNTRGLRSSVSLSFKGLDIDKAVEEFREKEAKTERKSTRKGYSFY